MDTITVRDQVIQILLENFERLSGDICPEHRIIQDLGLDSIEMVTLQIAIEDRFDFRFDPNFVDLAEVFYTVGSLINFLESNLNRNSP